MQWIGAMFHKSVNLVYSSDFKMNLKGEKTVLYPTVWQSCTKRTEIFCAQN